MIYIYTFKKIYKLKAIRLFCEVYYLTYEMYGNVLKLTISVQHHNLFRIEIDYFTVQEIIFPDHYYCFIRE